MLAPTVAILSLLSLSFIPSIANASPCVAMDSQFNLLVFGIGGKDFNAGQQDSWAGDTPAEDITTTGRPPFDGQGTTCYLSQFFNAVYFLNADASNPAAVHIYDATAKSWTTQSITDPSASTPSFNPTNFKTILDHDTNVFYALSEGQMFFLNMGDLKAANSSALTWSNVGTPNFETNGYDPVMAVALNHVHFLDVNGLNPGEARIFVIHFSYFQPEIQLYATDGGANFPQQHGQVSSFFRESGPQLEFAYVPDDASATYVINVETNTTHVLPGPPSSSPSHQYFAGISSLVQLDTTTGTLNFVPYTAGDFSANAQAAWNKVGRVVVPEGGVSGGSSSGSGTSSGSNGSGNGSGRVGSTGSSPNGTTTTDVDSNSGVSLGARTMIAPAATCLLAFSVFLALF